MAYGHYKAAQRFSSLNFVFGLPTVVFATIVGTSVFATLQSSPDLWWKIAVSAMSIAAAILSGLQSFLGYNEKAEKHRAAGSKYNAIGRELELWLAQAQEDLTRLEAIRQRIDSLAKESPHIPASVNSNLPDAEKSLLWTQ
ncbi:MAG: DUF4231 domain-containing protein [Betaproteobacteria bacterium]|nr:DUF4231 domain-containing protein [Betaproteobacteria bacterium]